MGRNRSSAHIGAQRKGRIRDHQTCQCCGSTHNPQGHHIVQHQWGGAASKDNIVTLCQDCHNEVHHGHLDIFRL